MELDQVNTRWTESRILELIRKLRNDLIKDFLDERLLRAYLEERFRATGMPNFKLQLIRQDLKERLIMPVNTHHYRELINQIRETDSAGIAENHESLFYEELNAVFKHHLYWKD